MAESLVIYKSGKRSREDSIIYCQKCETEVKVSVACSGCKFCLKCAPVSPALYECIEGANLAISIITVQVVKQHSHLLKIFTSNLKQSQYKNDKRMSDLEERISKLEKNSNDELKSNVQSMKGEIIDSTRNDIDKFVDNRNRELEDMRRRDHNIVCFNLPEHNSPIGTVNKEKDESDVLL